MKKFLCLCFSLFITASLCLIFVSCKSQSSNDKIRLYDISTKSIKELNFEDYIAGVTAAEIDESFAESAIEAQSVLARTFALYFLKNLKSKYSGADISNDITEAQAYSSNIPEKIKNCCNNTKGKIITFNNEVILPYYCSNCAGKNSLPSDIFTGNTISYYETVDTLENDENSQNYNWSCSLSKAQILSSMQKLNKNLASVNSFNIGQKDNSNRAKTFIISGVEVNSNDFRISVGSTILKSCLITNITVNKDDIFITGKGYGHGVGLSQWGANILANNNYNFVKIIYYYFKNCQISDV